jgi:chromatin remodeling complex protein RSC6
MSKSIQKKVSQVIAVPVVEPIVPVVEPIVPVVEPETTVSETGSETLSFNEIIKSALDEIVSLKTQVRNLETAIRSVKTLYKEEQKLNKSSKKRRRSEKTDKQVVTHGFVNPCTISEGLIEFLGLETGSTLARPQVTKLIAKYVNDNELWGTKMNKLGESVLNKTIIKPDAKLSKLFGKPTILFSQKKPELGFGYSYFNLHSYLKRQNHFLAPVKV